MYDEYDPIDIDSSINKAQNYLEKELGQPVMYLGTGRTRHTFAIDENWVVKIPKSDEYTYCNHREARLYASSPENLAPCILLNNELLLMERVKPISFDHPQFPEWGDYVDCGQVGITKNGKVVAYDYAY